MKLWKVGIAGLALYWAHKKGIIQYDSVTKQISLHMDALKTNAGQLATQASQYTQATAKTVAEQVAEKVTQSALPGARIEVIAAPTAPKIVYNQAVPAQSAFSQLLQGLGKADEWGYNRIGWN